MATWHPHTMVDRVISPQLGGASSAAIPGRARTQEAQGECGYLLLHQHAGLIRPPGGRRSRGRRISVVV